MNRHSLQTALGSALLLAAATTAADPRTAVPANALPFDCAAPTLPSQREVGKLTGQANFSQVYATRARLMAEVRRACQREGTTRVVVLQPPHLQDRKLALQPPAR